MSTIIKIFRRDCKNATRNVIALVVCIGLVVIPSLYAWFNIAGGWDPYGATGQLKIAVANSDRGYTSQTMPMEINIGQRVEATLRENQKFDWVFTTEQDAIDGVSSGEYYAAIVVPEDFTSDIMSVFSTSTRHAELRYYVNQKENAIAPIVTQKGASWLKNEIDRQFAQTVTGVGAAVMTDLGNYLDDDQILSVASALDRALTSGSKDIRRVSTHVGSYASLLSSASSLVSSSNDLLKTTGSSASSLKSLLNDTGNSVASVRQGLDSSRDAISGAVDKSSQSIDSLGSAVDDAFDVAANHTGEARKKLSSAASLTSHVAGDYGSLAEQLDSLAGTISDASAQAHVKAAATHARTTQATLFGISNALSTAADELTTDNVEAKRREVKEKIDAGKTEIEALKSNYSGKLDQKLTSLSDAISSTSSATSDVANKLDDAIGSLQSATGSAKADLEAMQDSLSDAQGKLGGMADKIDDTHARLKAALSSGDAKTIRTILSSDPDALASWIASPVQLDREAIYPVENNGSAMAPYYTTLALWVGATVLAAMLKTPLSEEALREAGGARPYQRYFGRLGIYLVLSFLQATLAMLGDLFFLGVQASDPIQMMVCAWVASFVFMNVIYALVASFGDVGKAVAVFLLVIQVAGSGGSFPKEMLPPLFQAFNPFLPFVPIMNGMRAAIAGSYGAEFWVCMGHALLFLAPALALGLVLRVPVIRVNDWFAEKLEDTKIM